MTEILETKQMRKEWSNIFKRQKKTNCQVRLLCPEKIYFTNQGEIKNIQTYKDWNNSTQADLYCKKY